MGILQKPLAQRLPIYTLAVSLLVGLFIGLPLNSQLRTHSETQINQTGQTLTSQLVKVVRDPIIHQDSLSLQVEVDAMLEMNGVQSVAIIDAGNRLLAEAKHAPNRAHQTSEHTSPIDIENTIAGYVTVTLDQRYFFAQVKSLQKTFIWIWLAITICLVLLSYYLGKKLTARLKRLIHQLPGDEAESQDEFVQLEQRLEPLLAAKQTTVPELTPHYISVLSITCRNLTQLESILNREHFNTLMSRLDELIDDAAALYGADRLTSYSGIHLIFRGEEEQAEHPQQAIYLATALFHLSRQLLSTQGVSVELAGAMTTGGQPPTSSQLLKERYLATQLEQLADLIKHAAVGDIVLDPATATHSSLSDMDISQPDENIPAHKINALDTSAEQLVIRQAALLAKNS